jgi:hypothetical protein
MPFDKGLNGLYGWRWLPVTVQSGEKSREWVAVKIRNAVVAGVLVLLLGNAQAELFDRGGGLLYDDVLKVTWLQDANYAKTSGYDADGKMNWGAANTWADNLVYHDSVSNTDYSDWRLPTVKPLNGVSFNMTIRYDGSTDRSYNVTSTNNELSYMYYVNLGLNSQFAPNGTQQQNYGIFNDNQNQWWAQNDVGPVNNLQNNAYWSGTRYPDNPSLGAWMLTFNNGFSNGYYAPSYEFYAWAVRDGDVASAAPIPEPETYAMLLAGLGLLGLTAKRRKQKLNA